ncbi:phthiocerol/phthiodiolone dimycocerosyl transferase family protein [Burkholderia ambifaria]|uniref:phthiocerol/phthiodiolone dimycocerosyl transferase family protein n=1 Tax=Burkholderia ambifaria TaxID=152480 RepID=UPI0011B20B79|nr:condensation domain-containing protein [Burkholderia ambifaria]
MNRRLGSTEHVFWLMNRVVASHVVMAAEIDGIAGAEAWRDAFDALQRRHPLLRARIPPTALGFPQLELVSERPIPVHHVDDARWEIDRISDAWLDSAIASMLDEAIDTDIGPLMRAVVASGQNGKSVLVLACAHAICDGISLTYCVRDLLQALSGQSLGILSMPRSLDQLYGEADVSPPVNKVIVDECRPRHCDRLTVSRLKLSRELTTRIVQRARDERTTFHGALCSAMLGYGRSINPAWRGKPIRIVTPVDLRRQLDIDDDVGLFGSATRASLAPTIDGSFWEDSRAITRELKPSAISQATRNSIRSMSELLTKGLDVQALSRVRESDAVQREITISNLGNLRFATQIGRFHITAIWGPCVPMGQRDDPNIQTVGVATVDGRANLTLASFAPLPSFLTGVAATLSSECRSFERASLSRVPDIKPGGQ